MVKETDELLEDPEVEQLEPEILSEDALRELEGTHSAVVGILRNYIGIIIDYQARPTIYLSRDSPHVWLVGVLQDPRAAFHWFSNKTELYTKIPAVANKSVLLKIHMTDPRLKAKDYRFYLANDHIIDAYFSSDWNGAICVPIEPQFNYPATEGQSAPPNPLMAIKEREAVFESPGRKKVSRKTRDGSGEEEK